MGLKLRGVVQCGACGKPRGITHLCNPGRRKRRRSSVQSPVTWECGKCHKKRGLQHTCNVRTDFKRRKKRQERRKKIAGERKVRDRTRKQKAKPRSRSRSGPNPRSRGGSHGPGTCGDRDCPRYPCVSYWRGWDDGYELGYEAGYGEGYEAGYAAGSAAAAS